MAPFGRLALTSARSRSPATGSLRLRAPIRDGRNAATAALHLGLRAFGRHLTSCIFLFCKRRGVAAEKADGRRKAAFFDQLLEGPKVH